MNSASTGERVCRVAAAALIGAVLILVINAPRNDGKLRARIESLKLSEELQPGEMLPPIEVPIVFPQPGSVRIPQPDTDVLVMFYSGECPLCRDAWRTWNTIADTAPKLRNLQMLAISVLDEESTQKDLARRESRTAVGLFVHTAKARAYKISKLPAIVYIRNGTVVEAWYGAVGQEQESCILQRIAGNGNPPARAP